MISPILAALFFLLVCGLMCILIWCGPSLLSKLCDGAGRAHPPDTHDGLSMDDIAALPTFKYWARAVPTPSPQRSWGGNRSESTSTGTAAAASAVCAVCLKDLADGDVVRVLPACRHFFHDDCIDPWLHEHSSCPVCRAYPEPERALRPGEAAQSPPLPQLRPFDVSLERPTPATRIFADILARSLLRIRGSTSGSNEPIASRSSTLSPVAGEYVLSRSPSRTPLTGGMVDEQCLSEPAGVRVGGHGCERAVVTIPAATLPVESSPQVPN